MLELKQYTKNLILEKLKNNKVCLKISNENEFKLFISTNIIEKNTYINNGEYFLQRFKQ